ncbi:uncharacterized protein DDB_G0283357-like [Oppia nitens]|uniref:uncharacterized protein DDB_G0283357-like n=1 Tax=Oppia nitens TaxID=1686743 RepID=UPI0023DB7D4A|nr:uncharacterized protein DDB_G0283357-like [Oppia nitens]
MDNHGDSHTDDSAGDIQCPLCMETLDFDDLGFFPCGCGYQVCRFCWNRLKNDDTNGGLCPACRQPYPDSPIQFTSISIETVEELKKRKKKQKEKQKLKDAAKSSNLSSIRVVQKNLLFVIGLPQRLSQDDLRKEFSKYGKIIKLVINASSAYVTYSRPEDAVAAIKALNETHTKSNRNKDSGSQQPLRASLGTTKYCTHWLRSQSCPKQPDCMYLHEMAEQEASFTKEEMQLGKHTDYEKRLIQHYSDLLAKEKAEKTNRKNAANSKTTNNTSTTTTNNNKNNSNNSNNNNNNENDNKTTNNNKNTNNSNHNKMQSKTIVIKNAPQKQPKQQSIIQTNGFGGDDGSNDSVGDNSTARSTSPVIPCRWGTPITAGGQHMSSDCSSNSESNSNSLSSTPNQTSTIPTIQSCDTQQQQQIVRKGQSGQQPLRLQQRILTQTFVKSNGELINNIDDNAMDGQIMSNNCVGDSDDIIDDDAEDDVGDEDGLDFDPISISSRGLQDLLRDTFITTHPQSSSTSMMGTGGDRGQHNNVFNNINSGGGGTNDIFMSSNQKLLSNSNNFYSSLSKQQQTSQQTNQFSSINNGFVNNNRQQMLSSNNAYNSYQQLPGLQSTGQGGGPQLQHMNQLSHQQQPPQQQQQSLSPQWQTQQQNSLRQLLPNVNIAFRQTPDQPLMGGVGGGTGLLANSNNFTGNSHTNSTQQQQIMANNLRQQQQYGHMGGQMMGRHMMSNMGSTGADNTNNVLSQYWNQSQHQQQQQQNSQRDHILRLQQQQQQHPIHRQQQQQQSFLTNQSTYWPPMGGTHGGQPSQQMTISSGVGSRQPPPGF